MILSTDYGNAVLFVYFIYIVFNNIWLLNVHVNF